MISLKAKCTKAREKLSLSIKEVAKQLGVPQYRRPARTAKRNIDSMPWPCSGGAVDEEVGGCEAGRGR